MAAAFPMFNKILIIMNMENTEMYAVCTGICFLVFAAMYVVIYSVTARTAAAFPMFNKILIIMNMENTEMYAVCTGICFLVFAAMYVVIYSVTARTYYRIVSK